MPVMEALPTHRTNVACRFCGNVDCVITSGFGFSRPGVGITYECLRCDGTADDFLDMVKLVDEHGNERDILPPPCGS